MQIAVRIVLSVVIVLLVFWLYQSITEPYKVVERQKELTELTRQRMGDIRKSMIRYEELNDRYLTTLDSLVNFVKSDSLYAAAMDSVFRPGFQPDSLPFSPRTGNRFILSVNDTSRTSTYLLEDPDTNDRIGTLLGDITLLNASSWE
ncbi:MAG: hypothetical protein HKN43_12300 [Rhodothermales bacterium]|nr:hypothetical protein [Rhodothermales bacterium]